MAALNLSLEFQWNVRNSLSESYVLAWLVGDGKLYWYRVESAPMSSSYYGLNTAGCFSESLTLLASSVSHLARQLRSQRFNKPISKISKWSRPALNCDIKALEAAGADFSCPTFVDINKCVPELYEFLQDGDCPLLDAELQPDITNPCIAARNPDVWYTKYASIVPNALLTLGDQVFKGQIIGTIDGTSLDFTLYDSDNVSLPVSQLYNLPTQGSPAGGSCTATCLNDDQTARAIACVYWPVDDSQRAWNQSLGDASHVGDNCYSMTWASDMTVPIGSSPPTSANGASVLCASGGSSIIGDVFDLGSDYIVIRHTDVGPRCPICGLEHTGGCPAPFVLSVSPSSADISGGTPIAILGTNFASVTGVYFSGLSVGFVVISSNQISVISPPWSLGPGAVDVVVETACGSASASFTFTSAFMAMASPAKSLRIRSDLPYLGSGELLYCRTSDSWQLQFHEGAYGGFCEWRASDNESRLTILISKGEKRSELCITFRPRSGCDIVVEGDSISGDKPLRTTVRDSLGVFKRSKIKVG